MERVTREYLLHYEHPELTLPRCSSLLLAGTALYLGFIRPLALREHEVGKEHSAHCA
jgi:IMP cyclohydrolase